MKDFPIDTLLRHLGIRATKEHEVWKARCPHPDHDDSTPSWSIVDKPGDRLHGSHYCHGCKWGGGPWELAAVVWGVSANDAGERLQTIGLGNSAPTTVADVPKVVVKDREPEGDEKFELPFGVVIPGPSGKWFWPALDYLAKRGVSRERADYWGAGYAVKGRLWNRVVFPVWDLAGRLLNYSARALDPTQSRYDTGKRRTGANPRRSIWGEHRWQGTGVVTVAEGVFSALALEAAGAPNPCALLGSELTEEKALALSRFSAVIVASDPDPAGDRVARWVSVLGRRARVVRLRLEVSPDDADQIGLKREIGRCLQKLEVSV